MEMEITTAFLKELKIQFNSIQHTFIGFYNV
jgi:hypothetical protein